jgi:hypothetical protein
MVSTATPQLQSDGGAFRFDRAELAGAVGDLGVLVPIAVALIVKTGTGAAVEGLRCDRYRARFRLR